MINFNTPVNPVNSFNKCFMRIPDGYNTCILGNPVQNGANVLSNCVGWVQGRALQIYMDVSDCDPINGQHIFNEFNCDPVNFLNVAKRKGFEIVSNPVVGSIFVTDSHVGIVEYKDSTGWLISESGYQYSGDAVLFQHSIYYSNGCWYSSFASPEKLIKGFIKIPKVKDSIGWFKPWILKDESRILKGWQKVKGKWYYLDSNGIMLTGWQKINNIWYYLSDATGEMLLGWQKLIWKNKSDWYYFNNSGSMVTGKQIIDGKVYYFDNGGRWINES